MISARRKGHDRQRDRCQPRRYQRGPRSRTRPISRRGGAPALEFSHRIHQGHRRRHPARAIRGRIAHAAGRVLKGLVDFGQRLEKHTGRAHDRNISRAHHGVNASADFAVRGRRGHGKPRARQRDGTRGRGRNHRGIRGCHRGKLRSSKSQVSQIIVPTV